MSFSVDKSSPVSKGTVTPVMVKEKWNRPIDFFVACVGFSIGLGNFWRFPYLCYKNGGGAFLLPYLLCLFVGGIPLFFLEVSLGQFMSEGGIAAWKICPLFQGIGYATTGIVFLLNCYYNVILAWAFYYLFASFTKQLPWSSCNNEWNSNSCRIFTKHDLQPNYSMNESRPMPSVNISSLLIGGNAIKDNLFENITFTDPVTEFWEKKVLGISKGIEFMGSIKWDLALCLVFAWLVVFFCIFKGIKTSGYVMYFTATAPYIFMIILLIRGLTLPGASKGLEFYLIPKWDRLLTMEVWVEAGTQIFFSYSIGNGALTALGSHNDFHHNSFRDSIMFAITNSGTSILCGFVIFSFLGFMAQEQGVLISEVAESGPGLVFIVYPKAITLMPFAPLWSVLFFLMVLLLGLDSQFVAVEGLVTAISDLFPILKSSYRKVLFTACVCITCLLVGLIMVTNGGMYVFQLFDYYSGSRIILLVAFFETVAVAWIYGVNRYYENLRMMYGFAVPRIIKFMLAVTAPAFTFTLFALCLYDYKELTYNKTYIYPTYAIIIGWTMAFGSFAMVPVVMIVKICQEKGSLKVRVRNLIKPQLESHQLQVWNSDIEKLHPHALSIDINELDMRTADEGKGSLLK